MSAVLTSPNRIWIIACFISGWWVREPLPILTQPQAEREAAAYKSTDFLDKRAKSGTSISPSPLCLCRLPILRDTERGRVKGKKYGHPIRSRSAFWTPTSSLKLLSWCLYEETEPTRFCLAKCLVEVSLWMKAQMGEICYPGGKHQGAVVFFTALPWTSTQLCVCVCEKEILSSIFSSTILSPKKPF